jgi:hypothetical protein
MSRDMRGIVHCGLAGAERGWGWCGVNEGAVFRRSVQLNRSGVTI